MSARNPIVFVHGNGDSAAGWQVQIDRFKAAGYGDAELHAITMTPPQNETHAHYAQQLKPYIDEVLAKTGAARVNVVAHSLGCTVLRYYLKFMGGAERVESAVLICGANHGIPACDLTLGDPATFKQSPEVNTLGAQFLKDLNTGNDGDLETFGPTRYMTISGPDDEFYFFYEDSPQLRGADNRVIKGHGHFGLRSSVEAFELTQAFFAGTAEGLALGKAPAPARPRQPLGAWEIIGGPRKGERYEFREDGGYSARDAQGGEYRGRYSVEPTTGRITLTQDAGPDGQGARQGIYRVNLNDSFLRLDVGELNGEAPAAIAYAPTFERVFEPTAIPAEFVGEWVIEELGFCAAGGWTAGRMSLAADGGFRIQGNNVLSPTGDFEISGRFAMSERAVPPQLTLELTATDGKIPFFLLGEVMPAIFARDGDTLRMQWGSATFGIPRPACMDAPALFVKR